MFLARVIVDFTQPNQLYFVRQARLIFPFSKAAFLVFGVRKFNFEEATHLPFLDASLMPRFFAFLVEGASVKTIFFCIYFSFYPPCSWASVRSEAPMPLY